MVSPTPLLERRPKIERSRRRFRPKRATGPRATSESNRLSRRGASSGLAARRTAFARGLGDRGRIPWPLRGPAIESIGRTASLRRRRTRGGSEPAFAPRRPDELRVALRARPHGPAPAGHTPRAEIIRSKRRALRPSGAARSPPRLCNFRASSTSAVDPARAQVRKKHHKTPHAPRAKCFQTKGGAFGQFVRKHAVPET